MKDGKKATLTKAMDVRIKMHVKIKGHAIRSKLGNVF